MPSTTEREAAISPSPPARPRLLLQPDRPGLALLTAISARDERTDLVTIPAHTSERDARAAMGQAVQAGNRDHAPAILAALRAAASPLLAAGPGSS